MLTLARLVVIPQDAHPFIVKENNASPCGITRGSGSIDLRGAQPLVEVAPRYGAVRVTSATKPEISAVTAFRLTARKTSASAAGSARFSKL